MRIADGFCQQHLFLVINHAEYFIRTKPTTCYGQFETFTPEYTNSRKQRPVYPGMFNFIFKRFLSNFNQLSTDYSFNVLVQDEIVKLTWPVDLLVIAKWMWSTKPSLC